MIKYGEHIPNTYRIIAKELKFRAWQDMQSIPLFYNQTPVSG